ncbi:hypothetical protein D9M70_631070 [compost metagenome]
MNRYNNSDKVAVSEVPSLLDHVRKLIGCKHYSVRSIRLSCPGTDYVRAKCHGRSRLTDSSWSIIRTPDLSRLAMVMVVDTGPWIRCMTKDCCRT